MKRYKYYFLIISGFVFLAQLLFIFREEAYVVGTLTNDDTYYYLQTVWNTVHLGVCSFDGITKTNGIQMLWYLVLCGVAFVAGTKSHLLLGTMVLCAFFNAVSAGVVFAFFNKMKNGNIIASLLMVILWCALIVKGSFWLGLENSMHAAIAWGIVWFLYAALSAEGNVNRRIRICLFLLLIANVYTRLDSAIVSLVIFLAFLVLQGRKMKRQVLVFWSILCLLAGLCLFAMYYALGNTFIPISGLVKSLWGGYEQSSPSVWHMLIWSFPEILPYSLTKNVFILLAEGLAFTIFLGMSVWDGIKGRYGSFGKLIAIIAIANIAYLMVYYVGNISYASYYRWYRSWQYIMWLLVIGFVLLKIAKVLLITTYIRYWQWALVVLLVVLGSLCVRQGIQKYRYPYEEYTWHQRYNAAKWISSNVTENAVIGAWNAGQIGFFSDRRTINLDGLINGKEYYENVLKGVTPLSEYLRKNSVSYLFDYPSGIHFLGDLNLNELTIARSFPRIEFGRKGEPMILWSYE